MGKRKYDPCSKWCDEPAVEDDFASSGDFGVAALIRSLIKALEAQGRVLHTGTRNITASPKTRPSISYSCSWDAVALVLQSTAKIPVRQIMSMALAPQSTWLKRSSWRG